MNRVEIHSLARLMATNLSLKTRGKLVNVLTRPKINGHVFIFLFPNESYEGAVDAIEALALKHKNGFSRIDADVLIREIRKEFPETDPRWRGQKRLGWQK